MPGPFLDPSTILLDPMLADTFTVLTRVETVNDYGESVQETTPTAGVVGVVVPASPDDLQRLDDLERGQRAIKIFTRYRLNGPSTARQPDLIVWRGDNFVVKTLDPFSNFGAGWTEVLATSIDTLETLT